MELAVTHFDYLFQEKRRHSGFRERLRIAVWVLSKVRLKNRLTEIRQPIVLVPLERRNRRSVELYEPVISHLQPHQYRLVTIEEWLDAIPIRLFFSWLFSLPRLLRQARIALHGAVNQGLLSAQDAAAVLPEILRNLLLIRNYRHVFGKGRIRLLVVDWDHDQHQSVAVVAARLSGVKTYGLVHGNVCDRSFPLLADSCICWGTLQKEYFRENGVDAGRLEIGGNPRFRKSSADRDAVLERLGISTKTKILLHFSQNFPEPDFDEVEFARIMEKGMRQAPGNWRLVIKPHPAQRREEFQSQMSAHTLILPADTALKEALAIADLAIIVNSTTIVDSILNKVPVVIFHPAAKPEDFVRQLVDETGTPVVHSPESLSDLLGQVELQGVEVAVQTSRQQEFMRSYCAYADDEAGFQISEILKHYVYSHPHPA